MAKKKKKKKPLTKYQKNKLIANGTKELEELCEKNDIKLNFYSTLAYTKIPKMIEIINFYLDNFNTSELKATARPRTPRTELDIEYNGKVIETIIFDKKVITTYRCIFPFDDIVFGKRVLEYFTQFKTMDEYRLYINSMVNNYYIENGKKVSTRYNVKNKTIVYSPELFRGIYLIENIETTKKYIGSSKNIMARWNSHIDLLLKNAHTNDDLQSDFNKYGIKSFLFSILETNVSNLSDIEQYYINKYKAVNIGYNKINAVENGGIQ